MFGTPMLGANARRTVVRLAEARLGELRDRTTGTWRRLAACKGLDPASFYVDDDEEPERVEEARAVCARCPVREACLEHAVAVREPHGMWGGLTARERRREVRRRKTTA